MDLIRTKLGKGGRIILPSSVRKYLDINTGDDILLHIDDHTVYITTPNQALHKLQIKVKSYKQTNQQDINTELLEHEN